jgi:regulator of sigma E protease
LVTTGIDAALATRTLDLSAQQLDDLGTDPAGKLGLKPFMPRMDAIVGSVSPNSPAQTAGLKTDDLIVAIDDMPVSEWAQVVARIRPAYGKSLKLEIMRGPRGGEETSLVFNIVPAQATENGELVGRLGIAVKPDPSSLKAMTVRIVRGPVEALKSALDEVWYTSALTLRMIGRMIVGELSLKNLSGPVSIAEYAGQSAHMGLSPYLVFIALISISLGVLNLLPIPVLDGGHLMYYLAELFKGSPVSDRVAEVGQKIGVGALGLLMLFALYNDFHRLISG